MLGLLKNSLILMGLTAASVVYANTDMKQNLGETVMVQKQYQSTTVPTQFISSNGVSFAYREYGQQNGGTPVIFLNHLAAVLDNWDPRIIDGIAAKHHVVIFDNRGVGASTGEPAKSIEQMADDAITFIQAKGFKQVDLFGFSMGGHDFARDCFETTTIDPKNDFIGNWSRRGAGDQYSGASFKLGFSPWYDDSTRS